MSEQRVALRTRLGISEDELLCIYTGQFTEAKSPATLAEAVELLVLGGVKARGLFVGNGPQRDALSRFSHSLVLDFMQNSELPVYYRAADVGVWPTQESTSMLDAAACGLPIVVNHTLQAIERIDGNGLTYRLGDPKSLADVLRRLLDKSLRESLGSAGASKMLDRYSWRDLARKRLADYEAAIASG
jgi:glycosyltransferase involved in cell wall biosynthesis